MSDCRDSSLSLKRLCDKLQVQCPKCPHKTERCLLADHLKNCPNNPAANHKKQKLKDTQTELRGRSRSRDRLEGGAKSKVKKSRDRLAPRSRSRDALNSRTRSIERLEARSTENLAEIDFASEIERDIERINLMQGIYKISIAYNCIFSYNFKSSVQFMPSFFGLTFRWISTNSVKT